MHVVQHSRPAVYLAEVEKHRRRREPVFRELQRTLLLEHTAYRATPERKPLLLKREPPAVRRHLAKRVSLEAPEQISIRGLESPYANIGSTLAPVDANQLGRMQIANRPP